MNSRLKLALDALDARRDAIAKADEDAIETLKLVLAAAGEHGVSITPLDYTAGYVAIAEVEPQAFFPITLVRYWQGKLEVFVSDYWKHDDCWEILPDGHWVDYVDAHTDTWFLLDEVCENLEWADGYDD